MRMPKLALIVALAIVAVLVVTYLFYVSVGAD
jgi:hypothetical protein